MTPALLTTTGSELYTYSFYAKKVFREHTSNRIGTGPNRSGEIQNPK
jgi:hypothetical protein